MADNTTISELDVYILTYNCGLKGIDIDAFASQLFSGLTSSKLPDILVLSLQEIAPIPYALIGGSFLVPYFSRFYHAVQKAAKKLSATSGPVYSPIAARNLGITAVMVFAKDSTAIQGIETGGIGVGLAEMGNKGAVGVRFTYHENGASTELTFVAAHLAAMEDGLKRRNEDWKSIARGLIFSSTTSDSKKAAISQSAETRPLLSISPKDASIYKPTSHLFPHYDRSSPNHYSALFESDQLNQERRAGRTLQGLTEAAVTFPPTYKYDLKEPFLTPDEDLTQWHWAKHRWPSWCDRILYLDIPSWLSTSKPQAKITTHKYSALPLLPTSDHRPVALEVSVPLVQIPSPPENDEGNDPRIHPPFELDINWKARRERARTMELVVGFTMYFTTTLEGAGIMVAMVVGTVGAYFALKSMLEF